MQPAVFPHPAFPDHALLDSGDGRRLERFGDVVLARPDPQAIWRRRLPSEAWRAADLSFERESDRGGRWRTGPDAPAHARGRDAEWTLAFDGARLFVRPTPFKHVGVFPEQAANWRWVSALAPRLVEAREEPPELLNLFGYTGAASVLAVRAGFRVTHVDASRLSLAWARDNARASGADEQSLRLVLEDARLFVQREGRRGRRYAGVLLDPPHYGRGPKGEKWQLEEHLADLLAGVEELLDPRAFVCLSAYGVGLLPLALVNLLAALGPGAVAAGELALPEEAGEAGPPPRLLSCGLCARWSRGLGEEA